jgi:hypothetical protein
MQTRIGELTKQRLSDFFVKEDGHVAHKNALVAGTVATGAIFASMLLTPDTAQADDDFFMCGDPDNHVMCERFEEDCRSGFHINGDVFYFCVDL